MNKIPVNMLHEGLTFSEPVYIDGNNLLVPAGIAIRQKDLDQLNIWGVEMVETEGDILIELPQDEEGPASGPKKAAPAGAGGGPAQIPAKGGGETTPYLNLIEQLDAIFEQIRSGDSADKQSINAVTDDLLKLIREERGEIVGYVLGEAVNGRELAKNSVNTAILSAVTAMELKFPGPRLVEVITGALLHDTGMLRLPREILDKRGGLSASELQRMQEHPLHSYQIIRKELQYPEEVGLIAIQHHECWNGEGYPRRLSRQAINMGARIVSVADAFEAMVSEKPYRNSLIGYQAVKNLLSDNSLRFDPVVLKAFIKTMGLYPIGSIVLLNDGVVAKVLKVPKDIPLRPTVRVLFDRSGKEFHRNEGAAIDLLKEKSLFITRALNPKELAKKRG
jgi:HD-GYP domain-containing protein (c-di-GMP phosphodiesterase class II)